MCCKFVLVFRIAVRRKECANEIEFFKQCWWKLPCIAVEEGKPSPDREFRF